ncbi:MAG: PEP-utilizing enzyme [Actinomycetota bacterium]|nr:PEP-utilizing enzyme [Actinomycetota bacterium]
MRTRARTDARGRPHLREEIAPATGTRFAIALDEATATDPRITGAKAAALARASAMGLPTLPGFVVTTEAVGDLLERGRFRPEADARVREAWASLSQRGSVSLVVRSSSVAEDGSESSMAGMFTSVTNVMGLEAFLAALSEVAHSARRPNEAVLPMAILVQPFLASDSGGVLFGVDPVTGSDDHLVVAAIEGPPEDLVSGRVQGSRYVLTKSGRLVEAEPGSGGATLGGARRRALAGLASHARRAFGGPQDIEWAIDHEGRLWLLQSRPVTATGATERPTGPLLGPGPVAETFPDPLSLLEEDLWVDPLRDALATALSLVRAAPAKRLRSSPILVSVGGRIAADLELLGAATVKRSLLRRLDPRPPARRLRAGWDVGRLRAALPTLAARLLATIDDELEKLPPLAEMTDVALGDLLVRAKRSLVAVNGHEVLAGMLMAPDASASTGAALGLRALVAGRAAGLGDAELAARHPEVLALVPPAIGRRSALPSASTAPALSGPADPLAHAREQCRLRARWLQELSARVAEEIGARFAAGGILQDADDVLLLRVDEIATMVAARRFPPELDRRARRSAPPPLPAEFRLGANGAVIPQESDGAQAGRGAGGGRAKGPVVHDPPLVSAGDVLVVRTLDPDLAPVLPMLGGLVAETGSVLSHLAILAREFGVPTVVGVAGALERFDVGEVVVLDGTTGEVSVIHEVERAS